MATPRCQAAPTLAAALKGLIRVNALVNSPVVARSSASGEAAAGWRQHAALEEPTNDTDIKPCAAGKRPAGSQAVRWLSRDRWFLDHIAAFWITGMKVKLSSSSNFTEYESTKRTLGADAGASVSSTSVLRVMRKCRMRREAPYPAYKRPAISIRCKTVGLIRRGKRRIRH